MAHGLSRWLPAALAAAWLAACAAAGGGPLSATSLDDLTARLGAPTATYALPGGGQRLEFARGPYGRVTWMADTDGAGRLLRVEQVLEGAHFAQVADGMPRDELLRLLGRPAQVNGKWRGGQIWAWRYETNDCLWFVVEMDADGKVQGGGAYLPDPRCDAPNDKGS